MGRRKIPRSGGISSEQTEPQAPAAAVAEPLSAARSIDLDPDDWLWASWRTRVPRHLPQLAPFDLESCLDRLAQVTRNRQTLIWNWSKILPLPFMTCEEAHFWLVAISEVIRREVQPGYFVRELRTKAKSFNGTLSVEQ